MQIRLLFVLTCIASLALSSQAQTLSLDPETSEIKVSGTSTHNDWIVTVSVTEGILIIEDGIPLTIDLKFKVSSMDGGRGNMMNDIITKTLKEPDHPWIHYQSNSIKKITGNSENNFQSSGKLSIAGEEREITISATAGSDLKEFNSETPLKFSTFNIKPPTALFGALKTGDDVVIHCKLNFKSEGS
jgi:polyisoprenoid-binding protein YceI